MRLFLSNSLKTAIVVAGVALFSSTLAHSQDVTLRLHQFLPSQALIPAKILQPWAKNVEEATNGRVKIEHFDSMALGGTPPSLYDQAKDGVVDIIMTLPGYTPGRFMKTEVFELPFMMENPEATSRAFWHLVDAEMQNEEYRDVKMLGAWVHAPGHLHTKEKIENLSDLKGKKLRGPSRVITKLIDHLGGTPVGMPVPAVPQSLSKGVIDGTALPWEVTQILKVPELVSHHLEFKGDKALYTATLILAMNKDKWNALEPELQEAIMSVSGEDFSAFATREMVAGDIPARNFAVSLGNEIITLDNEGIKPWQEAAQSVYTEWVEEMNKIKIDGDALIGKAKNLIAEKSE